MPGQSSRFQQLARIPPVGGAGEEEQLGSDVPVATLLRVLVGDIEEIGQVARDVHLARRALHLGQPVDRLGQGLFQGIWIAAGLRDERSDTAVLLVQEGQQQMLGLDLLVVAPEREALGLGQGLLQLGRELVESHRVDLDEFPSVQMGSFCAKSSRV